MDDEGIFGITKLKLQAFSLAALEMSLGDIVVKVSSMMERTSIQIAMTLRGDAAWITCCRTRYGPELATAKWETERTRSSHAPSHSYTLY